MRRQPTGSDSGFTLIELLVTLSIGAVLTGLAGTSLAGWSASNAHKGTRDEVVSELRTTAQQALTEGRTLCVAFGSDGTWRTYHSSCEATSPSRLLRTGSANTAGSTVVGSFTPTPGLQSACTVVASPSSCAYFYPRGTASAGTVTVTRSGKPTYTVNVEQLTSRVYSN